MTHHKLAQKISTNVERREAIVNWFDIHTEAHRSLACSLCRIVSVAFEDMIEYLFKYDRALRCLKTGRGLYILSIVARKTINRRLISKSGKSSSRRIDVVSMIRGMSKSLAL